MVHPVVGTQVGQLRPFQQGQRAFNIAGVGHRQSQAGPQRARHAAVFGVQAFQATRQDGYRLAKAPGLRQQVAQVVARRRVAVGVQLFVQQTDGVAQGAF